MEYMERIKERKSVRAYKEKKIPDQVLEELRAHFENGMRLIPDIEMELYFLDSDVKDKLEGAAGYKGFMIGAPRYTLLLSERKEYYIENAGYAGEDLVLKMTALGLGSCWLSCRDSDRVKESLGLRSDKEVVAIIAFGYKERESKIISLYIKSMSDVDVKVRKGYELPHMTVDEMVSLHRWGEAPAHRLEEMGQTALLDAFQAACLAPTYRNRQPYGMIFDTDQAAVVALVIREDEHTDETSAKLNAGVIMQHFAAVLSPWHPGLSWQMGTLDKDYGLPPDHSIVAHCSV